MIGFKTTVPDLTIVTKDRKMWRGISVDAKKEMIKRTQRGRDIRGFPFPKYTPEYAKAKAEGKIKGHGARGAGVVNLTLSGRMLNSIARRVLDTKAFLVLSGTEGGKAWSNELKGRRFFDISKQEANKIVKRVANWLSKKNGLK